MNRRKILSFFHRKYAEDLSHYEFRNKSEGWHQFKPVLKINDIDVSIQYAKKNSFMLMYNTCFLDRPCCYECKFAHYERNSDITLADFWNVGSICPEMDDNTGTSQVLVNTETGQRLFNECLDAIRIQECSQKDVWQPHLEYPTSTIPSKRERFWKTYKTMPFDKTLAKYGKGDAMTKCKQFAIPIVKKIGLYVLAGKLYRIIFVKKEQ